MRIGSKAFTYDKPLRMEVPTDKFLVNFGYKDRSSVQIRLEKNGDVYASVFPEHISCGAATATVPLNMFVEKFREFVHHLAAYHHKEMEAKSE